jgi:molybdopterin-guanine dinucleotide biosynthesis protein B
MLEKKPKMISVVGFHNSGKTTLIEQIIKTLKEEGIEVGYIKHDPKGHGLTDKEGSDTDRILKITRRVALISPNRITLWDKNVYEPPTAVEEFFKGYDLVILEGFKSYKELPKIGVGDIEVEGIVFRFKAKEDFSALIEFLREFLKG